MFVKRAEQDHVAPTASVRVGAVLDELLAVSRAADLLALGAHGVNSLRDRILGKHGRSAVEDFLFGRVARHALVNAECDALVVPQSDIGQQH